MPDAVSNPGRKRVLFIDDDPLFLSTLTQLLGAFSGNAWDIVTVDSAGKALELLQEGQFQMAVVDIQMPVVDGLQFLTLVNRKYPNLQKVVLTGFATDDYRAACLSNGAELFLEKPKTPAEYETLHTTLSELLKFHAEEGFRGVLRRVGLEDVIQMECLSRHSAVLEVSGRDDRGEIHIRDGTIIHASSVGAEGVEAFNRLLALRGGEFRLKPFAEPPAESIQGPWEFLLMEAARMRDEGQGGSEGSETGRPAGMAEITGPGEIDMAGGVSFDAIPDMLSFRKPGGASSPPSAPPTPERPGRAGKAKIVVPEGMRVPAWVARLNAGGTEFVARGDSTTFRSAAGEMPRGGGDGGSVVQEAVVCNTEGEVLYRWQSPSTEKWVQLLEFVSQRSRQLVQGLPAGEFERIVVQSPEERVLVRLGPHCGAVARVTPGGAGSGGRR